MPSIKKEYIERLQDRMRSDKDDLLEVIRSFSETKKESRDEHSTLCPVCGAPHGLKVSPGKGIFKCFSCNLLAGHTSIDYLMSAQELSYVEAIEWLSRHWGWFIEYDEPPRKERKKPAGGDYCRRMLAESGLTREDVMAGIIDENGNKLKEPTFIKGTLDPRGQIDRKGDDAVILYYDLDGRPVEYTVTDRSGKESAPKTYCRVRYQFPEDHADDYNKSGMKYRSPKGAPTFIYFPQKIRAAYKNHLEIPRLFIQEGEKKAEKATKHGIMSVAVSGIQNLGRKDRKTGTSTLPEEIIRLIDVCQVKEVVFLLDSDCFDLSKALTTSDPVDKRPRNFFYAVKNYKEYFNRLKNRQLYVELYFGYVRKNEAGDKGIDDLLANSLKGHEDDLKADIDTAMNEKDLSGKWVQLHKISTSTDNKIAEIWKLQSAQAFCMNYRDQLQGLPEFVFGSGENRIKLRFNDKGELESAQPLEPDEQFWEEETSAKGRTDYSFYYVGAELFLEHRGFFRYARNNGEFDFVHVENSVVRTVQPHDIRDFVKTFTKTTLPKKILNMIYKGGTKYLGPDTLTMLDYFTGEFEQPARGVQRLFFGSDIWEITDGHIKCEDYTQLRFCIWADNKHDFAAKKCPELIRVHEQDGIYSYEITPEGKSCDFLRFLENASNFTWRKTSITDEDRNENAQHLVSKLAALGYLCVSVKDRSVARAVIGMDGKQSEVGVSNGRSGKSLLGEAVRKVINTMYYNGKEFRAGVFNPFIWTGVTEKTGLVFIDDAQRDFDFELLFGLITGDWPVNPKGEAPYVLPFASSPKVYVTTNHAVSGDGSSFTGRLWILGFSDYYNDQHEPKDDFGVLFFDEWSPEQWNLFWNLVAQCIQIYFRFGYVPAPGDRLEKRKLLQEIGEEFVLWADEYYSDPLRRNVRIARNEIYSNFLDFVGPGRRNFYNARTFKAKFIKYCSLKGFVFNPAGWDPVKKEYIKKDDDGRPLRDDKSNGVEYLTLGDENFNYDNSVSLFPDLSLPGMEDLPEG